MPRGLAFGALLATATVAVFAVLVVRVYHRLRGGNPPMPGDVINVAE